jgi:aldehyde dehydrogenase (NAD+)
VSVVMQSDPSPHTDVDSIPASVERVRAGFDSGRTRSEAWRRDQLGAIRALIKENVGTFEAALAADLGKPPLEGFLADLGVILQEAQAASKQLKRWMRPQKVATPLNMRPARARVVPEPLGVALIISPWNYPVQLLLSPLIGAVAAGNAAVLKPSELTPRVSAELARTVPRYLDNEAIALVEGGVEETTALLAERFDHIFYTGNGRVAQVVMAAAAKHLTPVTLELGGKSPCIIAEDADLEIAARRIAWGKFVNAGQTCIAPDYVLVHQSREQEFIDAIEKAVQGFYGPDPRQSPDYGRVVSTRHHQRLAGLLKDADVAFGGQLDEADRYVAPTVLRNVGPDSAAMQEEIFGPILPVMSVSSIDEAIDFVTGRDKPLALYLFTGDDAVEEDVLARTSSGGVCVNGTIWQVAHPHLPFGGVGPSGMGAYHGKASFDTFSHRKAVVSKGTRFDPKMMYPPYGSFKTKLIKRLLG